MCYVCEDHEGNEGPCVEVRRECEEFQDTCTSYVTYKGGWQCKSPQHCIFNNKSIMLMFNFYAEMKLCILQCCLYLLPQQKNNNNEMYSWFHFTYTVYNIIYSYFIHFIKSMFINMYWIVVGCFSTQLLRIKWPGLKGNTSYTRAVTPSMGVPAGLRCSPLTAPTRGTSTGLVSSAVTATYVTIKSRSLSHYLSSFKHGNS